VTPAPPAMDLNRRTFIVISACPVSQPSDGSKPSEGP
jgi:hypothetical protein